MLSNKDIESILSQISIGDLKLNLRYDGKRPYLQVACNNGTDTKTGNPASWTGRKWMLSRFMCRTEIVRTAYKAYMAAIKHEAQEIFKYKNAAIYSPHFNVEVLADIYSHGEQLYPNIEDTRENGMLAE